MLLMTVTSLYVTVSRATHYVVMSTAVMEVLQLAREYPVQHCMPSSVAKSSDRVSILSPDLGFESGRTANHLAVSRLMSVIAEL